MIIYIICFIISCILIKVSDKVKSNKIVYFIINTIALLIPCLLAAFRDTSIGTDVEVYVKQLFEKSEISKDFSNYLNCNWWWIYRIKYVSDFEAFVSESSMADFIDADISSILVSTIHKVKGKEFDNVFLLLEDFVPGTDEETRQLYVAVTRAKNSLSIHLNTSFLDSCDVPGMEYIIDRRFYDQPEEVSLQLTLRDVWLDGFARCQRALSELCCGDKLIVHGDSICDSSGNILVVFSRNFREKRYDVLKAKGYILNRAEVNFLVWWKGQNKDSELLVMLPRLQMRKVGVEGR